MSRILEQPPSCTRCGIVPEEMLVLSCGHNLCIDCASRNFRREQAKSKIQTNVLNYYS